jgi:hypothetical protein
MSHSQVTTSAIRGFRAALAAFAVLLGGLAIWVLAPEVLRPSTVGFTTDPQLAELSYRHRAAAVAAARIGLIRGDLWSEAAFSYGNMLWSADKNAPGAERPPMKETRAVTERAIGYAPHDSRLWLLLAASDLQSERFNAVSAALRMSYYTGPNTTEIVPERLGLALHSHALEDDEFRALVRHDIRVAVMRKAELMPALIVAYANAPPAGKQFVEKSLSELDPSTLAVIRSQGASSTTPFSADGPSR